MLRISTTTNTHFTRMVKGGFMSLVHNMNDRVPGAIQALAELHKAGFIEDVAYYRYAISSPLKYGGISYESVMLSRSKKLKLPRDCYADPSMLFDEIEIIVWKDLRGIVPVAPSGRRLTLISIMIATMMPEKPCFCFILLLYQLIGKT